MSALQLWAHRKSGGTVEINVAHIDAALAQAKLAFANDEIKWCEVARAGVQVFPIFRDSPCLLNGALSWNRRIGH